MAKKPQHHMDFMSEADPTAKQQNVRLLMFRSLYVGAETRDPCVVSIFAFNLVGLLKVRGTTLVLPARRSAIPGLHRESRCSIRSFPRDGFPVSGSHPQPSVTHVHMRPPVRIRWSRTLCLSYGSLGVGTDPPAPPWIGYRPMHLATHGREGA